MSNGAKKVRSLLLLIVILPLCVYIIGNGWRDLILYTVVVTISLLISYIKDGFPRRKSRG